MTTLQMISVVMTIGLLIVSTTLVVLAYEQRAIFLASGKKEWRYVLQLCVVISLFAYIAFHSFNPS